MMNPHKNRCPGEFRHAKVSKTLASEDEKLHAAVQSLYERTIDYGAHPNERGVSSNMTLEETPDRKTLQTIYLSGDSASLSLAMITTAQAGVGALSVFERVFKDRFRILGLDAKVHALRSGL